MEKFNLFKDIAERTGGDIYLGVVGPVRTGKSTFIKRFMELLVLPAIQDPNLRARTKDELPQSGAGKTIMTTEPKFVPEEAIEIKVEEGISFRVRLVDCVGYTVPGARGYEDEEGPRMVLTPWFADPIPFQQAAEIGTHKVIADHSTFGLVVTTDGSITDLARDNYVEAEERVVAELKAIGKPFLLILNSTHPFSPSTRDLAAQLAEKYNVAVFPVDCLQMTLSDLQELLHEALYEFPVREIAINFSRWVDVLPESYWLRSTAYNQVFQTLAATNRVRDVKMALGALEGLEFMATVNLKRVDLGTGTAELAIEVRRDLFYQALSELTGLVIQGDHHLLTLLTEMAAVKKKYDKVAQALEEVEETGYGITTPGMEDIIFEEPELYRQGHRFGVRLRAAAPSIHMIKTNIWAEVIPFMGTEKQGEQMLRYLTEEFEKDPSRIWNSEFLGKPMHELIRESLETKLTRMPESVRFKLQETLTKIVNEGSGGLICIIL